MASLEQLENILHTKYAGRANEIMDSEDSVTWKIERRALQEKINSMKAEERYGEEYRQVSAASRAQRLARGEICLELWITPR